MTKSKSLKRWLLSILAFVVVILLIAAAALWVMNNQRYTVQPLAAVPAAEQALGGPNTEGSAPDIAAAVAEAAKDPALGNFSAHVTDLATGQVAWAKEENRPMTPASSTKLLTAAAAILALDGESRARTTVSWGQEPGQLVITGDGDVTLAEKPGEGFFTEPATIAELAQRVQHSLGGGDQGSQGSQGSGQADQKITSIVVDNSPRAGQVFNETWDERDIDGGNVANLDLVMLNAARINPAKEDSPRSHSPGQDVAASLAEALGVPGVKVDVSDAPVATTRGLADVESATLDTRLRDMLVHSDNLLAEDIGRALAVHRGKPATFAGATEATLDILREHNIPLDGAELHDNSGMSTKNKLTATILDGVLAHKDLRPLLDMIPVSSVEGTLSGRYREGSGAEDAAGWVRAKTGTLSGVSALAGTVATESGRPLTFAFLSDGADIQTARPALDRLAAALRTAA